MLRKLVVAMTIAGALNQAHALGLGEIRLKSALNQPLDAEIELVQVRNLSSNEILPNLATRGDFQRAGVERPFFLSSLKFHSIVRPDGTAYVRVTSDRPVQEPFLNFLLEVHWPRGRLLREYTLLVDPPVFNGEAAAPVNVPARPAGNPSGNQRPVATIPPGNGQRAFYSQPSGAPGSVAPAQGQVHRQAQPATPGRKPAQSSYYRVGANDSLWNIANQIRTDDSVNLQQTMVAIQRANPRAFMSGNINRLMRGQVLRLPDREEIAAVSQGDARQSITRQNDQWQGKQQQLDATPRQQAEAAPRSIPVESQLKIVNAVDEEQGRSGAENNARQPGNLSQSNSDLENRLTLAMERMDRLADENHDLTSRLGDLDEQIRTLERLVSLKDEQLAMLQAELAKRDQQLSDAQNSLAVSPSQTPVTTMPPPAKNIDYNYESGESARNKQPQSQFTQQQTAPPPAGEPKPVQTEARPKPKPKPRPQMPPPQPVMEDDLLSNPLYLGGLGALLLALGGMLVYRKRKAEGTAVVADKAQEKVTALGEKEEKKKPSFMDSLQTLKEKLNVGLSFATLKQKFAFGKNKQDSKPLEEEDENAPVPLFADLPNTPQVAETGLQSASSKPKSKPVAPVVTVAQPQKPASEVVPVPETDEPGKDVAQQTDDVLSEADIYIAYGRLPQAADLLIKAIDGEPSRTDLRLKLMQVYVESGEQSSFSAQLDVLKELGDEVALAKADALSSHFTGGGSTAGDNPDSDFALSEDDLADIELDLGLDQPADPPIDEPGASDSEADRSAGDELDDLDLSFDDLDLDDITEPEAAIIAPESAASPERVVEPAPQAEPAAPSPPPPAAPPSLSFGAADDLNSPELEDLDLDLDLALDIDADESQGQSSPDNDTDILALDGFELDEEIAAAGSDASLNGVGIDVELDQLNKDLDQLSEELEGAPVSGQNASFSDDLSELDELSLELDEDLVTEPVNEISLEEELPRFEADDALGDEQEESGNDFEFLAGTDEASTKLDLARAYIDMGDAAGAKEILGEVLQEGDESQQKDARDLLARLDS